MVSFEVPRPLFPDLIVMIERLKKLVEALRPILATLVIILDKAAPFILLACAALFKFYKCLSSNVSTALYGIVISFFGGAFPVAISVMIVTCCSCRGQPTSICSHFAL
jgi:hypothetical protein